MCVRTDRLVKTKTLEMVWANRVVVIKTIAARRYIFLNLSLEIQRSCLALIRCVQLRVRMIGGLYKSNKSINKI